MNEAIRKWLSVFWKSPMALGVAALAVALSLGAVGPVYVLVGLVQTLGFMSFVEAATTLGAFAWVASALVIAAFAWLAWRGSVWLARSAFEDVKDASRLSREVLTARAEEREAIEEQGGMLSMSVGDGSGGELSQVSPASDGLDLVDEVVFGKTEDEDVVVASQAEEVAR